MSTYIAKCQINLTKDPTKQDKTGTLRKEYKIARMEVDWNLFLDRISRNQSCNPAEILNLLLSLPSLLMIFGFHYVRHFSPILLQINKAKLLQATGYFNKI